MRDDNLLTKADYVRAEVLYRKVIDAAPPLERPSPEVEIPADLDKEEDPVDRGLLLPVDLGANLELGSPTQPEQDDWYPDVEKVEPYAGDDLYVRMPPPMDAGLVEIGEAIGETRAWLDRWDAVRGVVDDPGAEQVSLSPLTRRNRRATHQGGLRSPARPHTQQQIADGVQQAVSDGEVSEAQARAAVDAIAAPAVDPPAPAPVTRAPVTELEKDQYVAAILAGAMTKAEAARRAGVSRTAVGKWYRQRAGRLTASAG